MTCAGLLHIEIVILSLLLGLQERASAAAGGKKKKGKEGGPAVPVGIPAELSMEEGKVDGVTKQGKQAKKRAFVRVYIACPWPTFTCVLCPE